VTIQQLTKRLKNWHSSPSCFIIEWW